MYTIKIEAFHCFQSNHEKLHISIRPTLTNKLRVLQNHLQKQATIELQNTTIEMEAGLASLAKLKDKNLGK